MSAMLVVGLLALFGGGPASADPEGPPSPSPGAGADPAEGGGTGEGDEPSDDDSDDGGAEGDESSDEPKDDNEEDDRRGPEIDSLEGTAIDSDEGWQGYGPLTLRFTAKDDADGDPSGLEGARVRLDHADEERAEASKPLYEEEAPENCSETCEIDAELEIADEALDEGINKLTIEATDEAGNVSEREVQIRKDRVAPVLDVSNELRDRSGKWLRDGSMKVRFKAADEDRDGPRAGVHTMKIRVNGEGRFDRDQRCRLDSSCSMDHRLDIDDDDLQEGENEIELRGADQAGNLATRTFRVFVDRSAPELDLSGSLLEAKRAPGLTEPAYGLRLDARDGSAESAQSGVGRLDVEVDGERRDSVTQPCPQGSCALTREWCLEPRDYLPGSHTVRALAYDQLGEPATERSFRVVVPPLAGLAHRPFDGALACQRLKSSGAAAKASELTDEGASVAPGASKTSAAPESSTGSFSALTTASYRDTVLATSGLLSYWRLGEAAGTSVAADEQSPIDNGTYANGPLRGQPGLIQGDTNTATQFDGVDDNVNIGNKHPAANNQAFSLEAWVKPGAPTSAVYPRIMARETSALAGYRMYMYHASEPDFPRRFACERKTAGVPNYIRGTTASQQGTRYRVACTYDGTTLRLFVNGVQEGSVTSPVALPSDTSPLLIGAATATGRSWSGIIDEAAFYSRALTSQENQDHYAAGNDTAPPETSITTGPSGTTQDDMPTFEFSSSETGSTFVCSVDSISNYTACTAPYRLTLQGSGTHTFRVKAKDASGNEDATPAERTFTIPELIYDSSADTASPAGWQANAGDPGPEWASTTERTGRSYMTERITPSQGPVLEGTNGYKMETRGGDYGAYDDPACNCERAELGNGNPTRPGFEGRLLEEGDDVYYGFAVYLPTNHVLGAWQVYWQSKSVAPAGWPESSLGVDGGGWYIDNNDEGYPGASTWLGTSTIAPATKGVWHRFVVRVKYSSDYSKGLQEVWHAVGTSGALTKKLSKTTHTLEAGKANHVRYGYYHSAMSGTTSTVFTDGFRAGRTYNAVVP